MHYRRLGKTGLMASALSVGTWQTTGPSTDYAAFARLIAHAFERGVNFFDTADCYAAGHAETLLGQALKPFPRSEYILSTKCFFPISGAVTNRGLSRKHIVESAQQSLARLQLDHIDILLCHRFDLETPLVETVSAMEDLIRQGRILYWGVSRWSADQVQRAADLAPEGYKPILVQSNYNMVNRGEAPVISWCAEHHTGFVAYSPLAQGVLTGKYLEGVPAGSRAADGAKRQTMHDYTERNLRIIRRYGEIAREAGVPLAALALAWCLQTPGVTSAVCGITGPQQLEENLMAAGLSLSKEVQERIGRAEREVHA